MGRGASPDDGMPEFEHGAASDVDCATAASAIASSSVALEREIAAIVLNAKRRVSTEMVERMDTMRMQHESGLVVMRETIARQDAELRDAAREREGSYAKIGTLIDRLGAGQMSRLAAALAKWKDGVIGLREARRRDTISLMKVRAGAVRNALSKWRSNAGRLRVARIEAHWR